MKSKKETKEKGSKPFPGICEVVPKQQTFPQHFDHQSKAWKPLQVLHATFRAIKLQHELVPH